MNKVEYVKYKSKKRVIKRYIAYTNEDKRRGDIKNK